MQHKDHTINASLLLLNDWFCRNGFSGFDPYDIKGHPLLVKLTYTGSRNFVVSLIREAVFEIIYYFPVICRKIMQIKPSVNAKAIGLLASSYLDLHFYDPHEEWGKRTIELLQWLKENKVTTPDGIGWGYPFDWQSKCLIPAHTPNGIVTTAAGEAFWKNYILNSDLESLEYCMSISRFLATLPIDVRENDQICFSYTPLFQNHVHNLNLFVAEFLIKTGKATSNKFWVELGNRAVNYTLASQHKDGSFDYNGPPETPDNHIDNYHTGFVLRMLHSIWKHTDRKDVYNALCRCYEHYIHNFFENDSIPKLMPNRKYRIDIHSCAESVHCLSELSQTFPEGLPFAKNILLWTITHLQDQSGYFYYGYLKSRFTGIPFKSKIPYIRWGQAWMMRAMTSYFLATNNRSN
jgi:hypothetical protein